MSFPCQRIKYQHLKKRQLRLLKRAILCCKRRAGKKNRGGRYPFIPLGSPPFLVVIHHMMVRHRSALVDNIEKEESSGSSVGSYFIFLHSFL